MNPCFQLRSSLNENPLVAMEYEQRTALAHLEQGSGPLHTASHWLNIVSGERALSSLHFHVRRVLSTLEKGSAHRA